MFKGTVKRKYFGDGWSWKVCDKRNQLNLHDLLSTSDAMAHHPGNQFNTLFRHVISALILQPLVFHEPHDIRFDRINIRELKDVNHNHTAIVSNRVMRGQREKQKPSW